jgi:DNA-formamidopyrimidine glycosylase
MPEGHTIHRLAVEIDQRFGRRPVAVSSPQGRFAAGAALLDGRKVTAANSHGKHLFVRFTGMQFLHVHLGLFGRFAFGNVPAPPPVGEVRMRLVNRSSWADLRGPTTCEVVDPDGRAAIEARLGSDPLRPEEGGEKAWKRLSRSPRPIADLVIDQTVLAGVGNVYRSELLFRAGMDPMREGRSLTEEEWSAMWPDIVALMAEGVERGRIDTVRPEHEPEAMGRPPRVDDHGGEVYVYRRQGQPCLVCGTEVRTKVLNGRNLFWCPVCQAAEQAPIGGL